jgi:hypothetical protein
MVPRKLPPPKTAWQPTFGDLVTVGALVVAVIMWFDPPNWQIAIPIVAVTIGAVIFTALRHKSHLLIRASIGGVVVVVLALVAWRPIWASFHKDYPRAAFNWPITLSPPVSPPQASPQNPPDMPPTNLPGPPLSKWGNAMFMCPRPPDVSDQDKAAIREQIRRNAEIYGKALNVDIVLSDIPYGVRIDVTARGSEGQLRLAGILRYTIQMETAPEGIFVTISMGMPGALSILGQVPMDRGSDIERTWQAQLEKLGFSPGKCRML